MRQIVLAFFFALLLAASVVSFAEQQVPQALDLQKDAELARTQQSPILLMVSAHYCSYCDLLKEKIIQPMIASGDYENRVLIRELLIDDEEYNDASNDHSNKARERTLAVTLF